MTTRALDTTESIFWAYEQHGAFRAAHTAVVEGPLTEALLQEALVRFQARETKLQLQIASSKEGPRFVPSTLTPSVAFVRRSLPQAQWAREAERELNGPGFPEEALPWRVGLLLGPDPQGPHGLILTLHHSLTDGLGSLRLLSTLLGCCAEVAAGAPPQTRAPSPLAPTLDERLFPIPGRRQLLRHRARNVLRRFSREQAQLLPFEGVAAPSERRTGVLFREIPAELFAELHHRARAARVSINGVLTTLTLDAVAAILGKQGELGVSTQVSLRTRCRPQLEPEHVGCYVSNVVTRHRLDDPRPLWGRAAEVTSAVQRALEEQPPQVALTAGRGRAMALERQLALMGADPLTQGRLGALSLSNRGPVHAPPAGPFQLRALFSPASLHVLGPCLQVSFGTVENRLCCTFSYPRPLLREQTVNAVAHELVHRITASATAEHPQRRAS